MAQAVQQNLTEAGALRASEVSRESGLIEKAGNKQRQVIDFANMSVYICIYVNTCEPTPLDKPAT